MNSRIRAQFVERGEGKGKTAHYRLCVSFSGTWGVGRNRPTGTSQRSRASPVPPQFGVVSGKCRNGRKVSFVADLSPSLSGSVGKLGRLQRNSEKTGALKLATQEYRRSGCVVSGRCGTHLGIVSSSTQKGILTFISQGC